MDPARPGRLGRAAAVGRAHGADRHPARASAPICAAVLGTALGNRLAAFAAGMGVTAILQSSTATGLMVAGFAAGGAVALVPALAVMLGANVGTTLIVQVAVVRRRRESRRR